MCLTPKKDKEPRDQFTLPGISSSGQHPGARTGDGLKGRTPGDTIWACPPVGSPPVRGAIGIRWRSINWLLRPTLVAWTSPLWWGKSLSYAWGWEMLTRYNQSHLNTHLGLWNQFTGEGLYSKLELPSARGNGQGWVFLYPINLGVFP